MPRKICTEYLLIGLIIMTAILTGSVKANAQGFFGSPTSGRTLVDLKTEYSKGTIIVSFADRRVYRIMDKRRAVAYPIAIPKGDAKWSGTYSVTRKAENPEWTPTSQMRRENPKLPSFVPGGHPHNPLGVRALYLGDTLYRIHGTDAPWLIGKAVSSGCIRMYNKDVIDLYNQTPLGTKVVVNWKQYEAASRQASLNTSSFFDSLVTN